MRILFDAATCAACHIHEGCKPFSNRQWWVIEMPFCEEQIPAGFLPWFFTDFVYLKDQACGLEQILTNIIVCAVGSDALYALGKTKSTPS